MTTLPNLALQKYSSDSPPLPWDVTGGVEQNEKSTQFIEANTETSTREMIRDSMKSLFQGQRRGRMRGKGQVDNSRSGQEQAKRGCWAKTRRVAGLITIEPSLLVHMTAAFMGNLLLSNLLLYKACTVNLGKGEGFCQALVDKPRGGPRSPEESEVQKVVTDIRLWSTIIDNSFPILYVLFLGGWSDTYGRKMPYLVSIFGYILRYGLLMLGAYFESWDANVIAIVSSLPVALTGSRTALSMIIYSYVADTTSIADRTLKMGMATAVRTFGKSMGSALGGQMASAGLGYYWIFGLAGLLDLIGFVYAWATLKDTRDPQVDENKSTLQKLKAIFNLNHIKEAGKSFFRKRENGDRARLFLLVIALTSTMIPMQAEESLLYNFTRLQLGWDVKKFGNYNTFRMIIAFLGGVGSVGILSKWMSLTDAVIGVISSMSQIGSSFVYCFASADWMMYLAPIVDILNGTMIIAARSMISKIIPRRETGKVNSFIGALDTITPLPSSPVYQAIYRATIDILPGTIFLFSAGVTIPALLVFGFLAIFRKREDRDPNVTTTSSSLERNADLVETEQSVVDTDAENLDDADLSIPDKNFTYNKAE